MLSNVKSFALLTAVLAFGALSAVAQNAVEAKTEPTPPQKEKPKKEEKSPKSAQNSANTTPEQVAESVIIVYSNFTGRQGLQQIRKTSIERGKISIFNEDGTQQQVNYERRIMRGDSLDKERIRLDQEFPDARYGLIYNERKIQGVFNDSAFVPREDASKAFQNQIWHGLEALLRYKENGSMVALNRREKHMGIEYYVLDVTDKENRKTTFFISTKTIRVMWLEYVHDSVKYTRKFYDYRVAQGTLVPYRNALFANGKQIEETTVYTVTFGQKVDEGLFQAS